MPLLGHGVYHALRCIYALGGSLPFVSAGTVRPPPDGRVHAGASLYVCAMRVLTSLMRLGPELCVGLLCLLPGFILMADGLVLLGLRCCLQMPSAGLAVVMVPGCRWPCSAFSV